MHLLEGDAYFNPYTQRLLEGSVYLRPGVN